MSAGEVLSAFHRDAPYLFSDAAFVAVGLVSATFAVIRRKRDSLLIYFAIFSIFYGLRLWIQATLLGITVQDSTLFDIRPCSGIGYIILIPAFLFFSSLGLPTRIDRIVAYSGIVVGTVLTLATFIFGPSASYCLINGVVVIAALSVLVFSKFMRVGRAAGNSAAKADFVATRSRNGRIIEVEENGLMLVAFDFAGYSNLPTDWNREIESCFIGTGLRKPPNDRVRSLRR
jgi:hypothetical protein